MNEHRYVELQVTSHFSFLRGASSCEELFTQAAMLGIELKLLEVSVHSESDARGLVGIDGVSTALCGMRV